ncbi:MAG: hypothetical protein WCD42_06615 [Rhizomicrobium sp.]
MPIVLTPTHCANGVTSCLTARDVFDTAGLIVFLVAAWHLTDIVGALLA